MIGGGPWGGNSPGPGFGVGITTGGQGTPVPGSSGIVVAPGSSVEVSVPLIRGHGGNVNVLVVTFPSGFVRITGTGGTSTLGTSHRRLMLVV